MYWQNRFYVFSHHSIFTGQNNYQVQLSNCLSFRSTWVQPLFLMGFVFLDLQLYNVCVCFVDRCFSFCPFSLGHCVVCSSIFGFWLPPFGIFKLFLWVEVWTHKTSLTPSLLLKCLCQARKVMGIDFTPFCDLDVWFLNCSDYVVFFAFQFMKHVFLLLLSLI